MAKFLGLFWGCLLSVYLLSGTLHAQEPLPPLRVHPLPPSLIPWLGTEDQDNYLANLETPSVGALVWSKFPITVYWEQPTDLGASAEAQRQQQWAQTVAQAVEEWSVYLPLTPVSQADGADIIIKRESPPLGSYINPATGKLEIPRARTAQARYEIYQTDSQPPLLAQRMEVFLSPGLGESLLLATCRHELGHALGIWGHSDRESDALFFSQVRHSPSISPRDINTLIKVYQQPTRIGWPILNS